MATGWESVETDSTIMLLVNDFFSSLSSWGILEEDLRGKKSERRVMTTRRLEEARVTLHLHHVLSPVRLLSLSAAFTWWRVSANQRVFFN